MKRQFMFGTMLAAVMAVGVGAQQPGQPGATGQAGQRSTDQSSRSVTVTGCLQSSPGSGQSATGDTTSRQQSGSQAQYILTNATTGSGTSGSSAGPTGTGTSGTGAPGSTSSSAGAGKTFRLQGGESSDLQKYVNSKVEVTGTLASSTGTTGSTTGSPTGTGTGSAAGTGTGSATGSTSSGSTAGMSGSMQTLRVTSVRQVAESCSGGESR